MVFCKVHLIIFTCSLELNKMNMLVFQLQLFCFCILAQVKKLSDFLVGKRTICTYVVLPVVQSFQQEPWTRTSRLTVWEISCALKRY